MTGQRVEEDRDSVGELVERPTRRYRKGERDKRKVVEKPLEVVAHLRDIQVLEPDEPGRFAGHAMDAGDRVLVVALDRVDRAVRVDGLDDADMLVAEEYQVAGLRDRAGGKVAPGLLGPGSDLRDRAEALATRAERGARLCGRPRGEVRTPRLA